jgi:hypothetical protein
MRKQFYLFSFIILLLSGCNDNGHEYGSRIINNVEEFRKQNKRLPEHVNELGLTGTEEAQVFYEKLSDTSYQVWYGPDPGKGKTYTSVERKWR